jgi:hypothetical protein
MIKGKIAQLKLRRAKKKGVLPKNSLKLYKAMGRAGLDI